MRALGRLANTRVSVVLLVLLASPLAWTQTSLRGWFNAAWGDGHPDDVQQVHMNYSLTLESGAVVELQVSEPLLASIGGLDTVRDRYVEVGGRVTRLRGNQIARMQIDAIFYQLDRSIDRDVSGSRPWISILCKFGDISTEPKTQTFFQNMYGNQPGQLDHYWREQSYDIIDVVGSTATPWRDLPQDQTDYVPNPGSGSDADLSTIFSDAIAAHDPFVDFSNGGTGGFDGINIMLNGLLDCCAWGGSRFATIDGVSKSWRVTWEPPWGYADEGVIGHEMGHGFGLPHSNNSDGDNSPYDSPWDVMSSATGYAVNDTTFGRLGKHTISYHKDRLGWIDPSEQVLASAPGIYSFVIDQIALPSTPNLRMVRIPIQGNANHYYTIEVRDRVGNYDGNLPGNAVIIHEVMIGRSEPAWVIDGDPVPATYSDSEGVMWRVGETFSDAPNNIFVDVIAATANGFEVRVSHLDCSPQSFFDAVALWGDTLDMIDLVNQLDCQ